MNKINIELDSELLSATKKNITDILNKIREYDYDEYIDNEDVSKLCKSLIILLCTQEEKDLFQVNELNAKIKELQKEISYTEQNLQSELQDTRTLEEIALELFEISKVPAWLRQNGTGMANMGIGSLRKSELDDTIDDVTALVNPVSPEFIDFLPSAREVMKKNKLSIEKYKEELVVLNYALIQTRCELNLKSKTNAAEKSNE